VQLTGGFTPSFGNSFDLLDWTTLVGTFAALQLPLLPGGLAWNTSQLYVDGSLLIGGIAGDYNYDSKVDAADYVLWRKTLGQTGSGLATDGNANGQIDQADFYVWRAHFGQTAGSGSGTSANTAVPEPATLVLLLFAAAGSYLRRARAE